MNEKDTDTYLKCRKIMSEICSRSNNGHETSSNAYWKVFVGAIWVKNYPRIIGIPKTDTKFSNQYKIFAIPKTTNIEIIILKIVPNDRLKPLIDSKLVNFVKNPEKGYPTTCSSS